MRNSSPAMHGIGYGPGGLGFGGANAAAYA